MVQDDLLLEKIKEFILQNSYANKDLIKYDTFIFKEGFLDSMGFVVLISYIENEFGIHPKDVDLIEDNFESINAIARFIKNKKEF